jgi:hypothetical protein
MKTVILSLLLYLLASPTAGEQVKLIGDSTLLTFENTDHELLNKTVFALINKERIKRKIDTLAFNSSLHQLAKKNQSELEFRTFKDPVKIQSKVNKKLEIKTKNTGYKGGIVVSLASQHNAINYEKGKAFFHLKNDKKNKLGLYYGTKKDFKDSKKTIQKIPNYSYVEFASALLKNLSSKQKKILYSKSHKDVGLQLNWHYKSLHKRKIPQIKMIAILGGYITIGTR